MSDTWIIPGGSALQENEDGAVWLVPGVAVVQEAEAAGGISIPVAMQNMRGGFNPIGMRGSFINAD